MDTGKVQSMTSRQSEAVNVQLQGQGNNYRSKRHLELLEGDGFSPFYNSFMKAISESREYLPEVEWVLLIHL